MEWENFLKECKSVSLEASGKLDTEKNRFNFSQIKRYCDCAPDVLINLFPWGRGKEVCYWEDFYEKLCERESQRT